MSQPPPDDLEARLANLARAGLEEGKNRRSPEQNAAALKRLFESTKDAAPEE